MYLYKVGTQSSVLINQGVLISEVSFKRGIVCGNGRVTMQEITNTIQQNEGG